MPLLVRGNEKTGRSVRTWSIPAVDTCPGSTIACREFCYATGHRYNMPSVRQALADKWKAALETDTFIEQMSAELSHLRPGTVIRLHASGDFFSVGYIRAWITLARRHPSLAMYTYTRSWRVPGLRRELNILRRLPNVRVWASTDTDTGPSPKGWLAAHTSEEFVPGQIACMEQTGAKGTCAECRLCFVVRTDKPVKLSFRHH